MDKQIQFFGKTASGIFCQSLFGSTGAFEKTAGAPAFAEWDNGDQLRRYIAKITKDERKKYAYVLVNALGAGEYFGSNINADYFPWNALAHQGDDYGYMTFLKAHAFQHHVNKDPTRAFGQPVLSLLNPRMKRVELLIRLDREKAKIEGADGIITRIDNGEFPDVSMGCKVPFDVCYVCDHRSKTKDDYCVHMKPSDEFRHLYGPNKILPNGMRCCVKNLNPRFFDISFVFIGADKTAKVMAKLASRGERICLGDVCTMPRLSTEVHELTSNELVKTALRFAPNPFSKGSKESEEYIKKTRAYATKRANENADHLRIPAPLVEKTASADCACGCPEGCSDDDQFEVAMTGKKPKVASQLKIGEITKTVPAGTFAMKSLPKLEKDEITISRSALDEMAEHDLGSACSTAGMMGIVLKPVEFQRLVLVRMGEKSLANDLESKRNVFRQSSNFDESLSIDKEKYNPLIESLLSGLVGSRSGFGNPLQTRMIRLSHTDKKTLPTESPIDHPLLDKIAEAYNGYRRSLLQKLSQAQEVIENDPKLREEVCGSQLVNMFSKTASAPVVTLDSLSYFAGIHLQNRDLLSDTPVDAGVASKFTTDQA